MSRCKDKKCDTEGEHDERQGDSDGGRKIGVWY